MRIHLVKASKRVVELLVLQSNARFLFDHESYSTFENDLLTKISSDVETLFRHVYLLDQARRHGDRESCSRSVKTDTITFPARCLELLRRSDDAIEEMLNYTNAVHQHFYTLFQSFIFGLSNV